MKILITDIHHGNGGGHATYIMSLLRGLPGHYDITVAAPASGRLFRYASHAGRGRVMPALYSSRIASLAQEVVRLRAFLVRERYDLVHVNASADHRHVMLASMGLQRPPKIVWTKHNLKPVASVGHRLRANLGTDAVIAVSDYVKRMLEDSVYGARPIHVVRHGIDVSAFRPVDPDEKRRLRRLLLGDIPDDTLVLGSTAGTDLEKGWLDLAAAVAGLSPLEQSRIVVVVAGDPPPAHLLRRLADTGIRARVHFTGLVDDIRGVLGASDIGFVLSYSESLSYACRESLACGLPTLITDVGGLPENLSHGREGWIVPVRNVPAIQAVLRDVLSNPQRVLPMGLAARRHSERDFCPHAFIERTIAVYESVRSAPSAAALYNKAHDPYTHVPPSR